MTRRDLLAAAVGAVLMLVVALGVSAVAGGDDPATLPTASDLTPDVPPPPEIDPVESAAPEDTDGDEQEEEEEEQDEEEGEEPTEAPLLADAAPAGEGPLPDTTPVTCPTATTTVGTADELEDALDDVEPGDVVELEPGTYDGTFVAETSGTEQQPIFLCGPTEAILDGGDVDDGYVLHLDGATHWRVVGFTITDGQKGLMADTTVGSVIQDLTVTGIGDEAIHLRTHSTDNVVQGNTVSDTGLSNEKYGEGVYLGSAVSNWCTYTDCEADRSDRNVVIGNTVSEVTSEGVDVKEGTTGGVVVGNTFDGSALVGADSWVDVKGNNYLVADNVGVNSTEDGYQTHEILPGWGDLNLFRGNTADVNGPGHAISSWPPLSNVVTCDNQFSAAGEGLSNIPCT